MFWCLKIYLNKHMQYTSGAQAFLTTYSFAQMCEGVNTCMNVWIFGTRTPTLLTKQSTNPNHTIAPIWKWKTTIVNSFVYSHIHTCIDTFTHWLIHSCIHPFTISHIHRLAWLFSHLIVHSLAYTLVYSNIRSLTQLFTPSHIYLIIHSLPHPTSSQLFTHSSND